MNVSKRKEFSQLSGFINDLIKQLQFKKYPVQLSGTASMESQYYASDYDLFTDIHKANIISSIFKEINRIVKIDHPNIYFMEFKIQFLNGQKIKFFDLPFTISKDMNRNEIEFLKIDWVIYENFQFTDVSIIYNLNKTEQSNDEIIKLIKKDMTEFYNDGMIYKSLKRYFSICNLLGDQKTMVKLSSLFNSKYGKMYKICSNLGTILSIKKKYPSDQLNKKIKANLHHFELPDDMDDKAIEKYINKYSKLYNNEALKYYKKLGITIQ